MPCWSSEPLIGFPKSLSPSAIPSCLLPSRHQPHQPIGTGYERRRGFSGSREDEQRQQEKSGDQPANTLEGSNEGSEGS